MRTKNNTQLLHKMKTQLPATIRDLLNSRGFDIFRDSKLGNDLFISDPDRAERIHDAAENGANGSTHAEQIEDWREYVEQLKEEAEREAWRADNDEEGESMEKEIEQWHNAISAEIDACETWHERNGSLHEEIG